MSESQYTRHPGRRVFASEFNDGTYVFKESDDDRAPNFQLLPTGVRANRVFVVGTVTEVEDLSDSPDESFYRARVVDPTGTFLVYAGQYQQEASAKLADIDTPEYVAVGGKVRSYEPDDDDGDDDDTVIMSIRPDDFLVVTDSQQRDKWVRETAAHTIERIEEFDGESPDGSMVGDEYDVEPGNYNSTVIDALESLEIDSLSDDSSESGSDGADSSESQDDDSSESTETDDETTSDTDDDTTEAETDDGEDSE